MTKKSTKKQAQHPTMKKVIGGNDGISIAEKLSDAEMKTEQQHIENIPSIKRTAMSQELANTLFKDVEKFTKEHGTLSIFELNDVFIKLIHSYNKQMLVKEYQNMDHEYHRD